MTVYVVTGRHRSGTSMMMRALAAASSLTPVTSPELEKRYRAAERQGDYDPAPNGYYAPPPSFENLADETLVKCPITMIHQLPPGDYRVVWMYRHLEERRTSFTRSFGDEPDPMDTVGRVLRLREQILAERADCKITYLNYRRVVETPGRVFLRLRAEEWPINPGIAADRIDHALWRHRVAL